jgi:hypothetical protein
MARDALMRFLVSLGACARKDSCFFVEEVYFEGTHTSICLSRIFEQQI